jgi:hypothetical protein
MLLLVASDVDHSVVHGGVVGLDESIDGWNWLHLIEVGLSEFTPDLWEVDLLSVNIGLNEILFMVKQNLHGKHMLVVLLVDSESFIVKTIFLLKSNLSQLKTVIVVKSLDVVHNSDFVSLDGSNDEQVLKVLVSSKSTVVQNDSLE